MPNCSTSLAVRRHRHEVLGDGLGIAERAQAPVAGGVRIGHGFQRGEGLGGDDKQRLRRVEISSGLGEIGAVDVRHKMEGQIAGAVGFERFVGHHRAEVRAADADVDDVTDAFAGVPLPCAAAHLAGEVGHALQHLVHLRHHVLAIHDDRLPLRGAQRHVQHGTILRDVDPVAAEHGVDAVHAVRMPRRAAMSRRMVSSVMRCFE